MSIGLEFRVDKIISKYNSLEGRIAEVEKAIEETDQELVLMPRKKIVLNESSTLIRKFSENLRAKYVGKIEGIVTSALQEVFYPIRDKFVIQNEDTVSRSSIGLYIENENGNRYNPISSKGGGVCSIVSVILKVLIKGIYENRIEGPIILDESFGALHYIGDQENNYVSKAFNFLREISDNYKQQFIMVTGKEQLVLDPTFKDVIDKQFATEKSSDEVDFCEVKLEYERTEQGY